ncbi:MAG: chorismate synthase [Clostridia bacterium]|nr:chorismate synthase [Clostridia bacterium]
MKNTYGNNLTLTLFGESHGKAIGAVLDGIAAGIAVDEAFINSQLSKRRAADEISTARKEADEVKILSGVFNGHTTGTPICFVIENNDTKSKDYSDTYGKARPGHADYTAFVKYGGNEDFRGGGHFSGRITAPIVAAGALVISALRNKGIYIGTHIKECAGVPDRAFSDLYADVTAVNEKSFAVLDENKGEKMRENILKAKEEGDSVGGILETAVIGIPAGAGEPWFDSVESMLSHGLFSIPAVKGVEFGAGFAFADMKGSEANDSFVANDRNITTVTNNNGGINGGITNGMPILFSCVVKPTPSIVKPQQTVDFIKGENVTLSVKGRHDPCIVHRARVVVDSIAALTLADLLVGRYGTDYLKD